MAIGGTPVWSMACCTGGEGGVGGANGPPSIEAGSMGLASDTRRPVRTCATARAQAPSSIRFSVPSSSSSPHRPQLLTCSDTGRLPQA